MFDNYNQNKPSNFELQLTLIWKLEQFFWIFVML